MWHSIFALGVSLGEKVIRTVLIYLFLLVAFRVFGKRELGQASTLDLAVLVLVANAVQNGIIGNDLSVTGAVVGAVVLFGLNAAFARAAFRYPWMSWLLEGDPSTLISQGRLNRRVLRREHLVTRLAVDGPTAGLCGPRRGIHSDPRDQRRRIDVPQERGGPVSP
jgi:uncharacterized membrane protein YcaP (DUF421 family)